MSIIEATAPTPTQTQQLCKIIIRCPAIINEQTKDFPIPPLLPTQTLLHLKTLISSDHPCHPSLGEQRLIYKGKLLKDNSKELCSLFDFADHSDSSIVVHLVLPVVRYGSPVVYDDGLDGTCESMDDDNNSNNKVSDANDVLETNATTTNTAESSDVIYLDGNNFYTSNNVTNTSKLNIRQLKTINAYNTLLKRITLRGSISNTNIREEIRSLRSEIVQQDRTDDEHYFDINIRLFELMNTLHTMEPVVQQQQQRHQLPLPNEHENVRVIRIDLQFILKIITHLGVIVYLWWNKNTKLYMVTYVILMLVMAVVQHFLRPEGVAAVAAARRRGAGADNNDTVSDFIRDAWKVVLGPFRQRRMLMGIDGGSINGSTNNQTTNNQNIKIPLLIRMTEFVSAFFLSMFPELPANLQ